MQAVFPREVVAIAALLHQAGFEAYVVGGSVRDLLLSRSIHDWDFTTNATPEKIQAIFPESFYENDFGTVGIATEHLFALLGLTWPEDAQSEVFEVTTYRSEGTYTDFRRPDSVSWGKSIEEDLQRRDFTVNALALKIDFPSDFEFSSGNLARLSETVQLPFSLIDAYDGQKDLKEKRIRTVGNAVDRFQEDALRMLRAIRLSAQLEFQLDQDVVIALQAQSKLIEQISWERIRDEFLKILTTDHVEDALSLMYTTRLLHYILPELVATRGVDQRGHHEYDVWAHSIRACQTCPTTDPIVKLAALLHDIAKPETQAPLPETPGEFSFYNHEVIGARTARNIAQRLRLSKDDIQRVFTLVRWHMFYYQSSMTDAAIRRFIRRVGRENIDDIIALREGDRLGSGSKRTSWRLEEMKERIHEQLHQPMNIGEMVVDGHDVMELYGIKPGPRIGEILSELFEEVIDDPAKNNREYLLQRLGELHAAENN